MWADLILWVAHEVYQDQEQDSSESVKILLESRQDFFGNVAQRHVLGLSRGRSAARFGSFY